MGGGHLVIFRHLGCDSSSVARSGGCGRVHGASRATESTMALGDDAWSVVVAATADRVSHRPQYPQHRSDDDEDDPDGPQDRDLERESGDEKDDSEDDHDDPPVSMSRRMFRVGQSVLHASSTPFTTSASSYLVSARSALRTMLRWNRLWPLRAHPNKGEVTK